MVALIAGVVLLIVGVVLFFLRRSQEGKLQAITSTESATVGQLTQAANELAGQKGQAGGFRRLVDMSGTIRNEKPLTSEIAQQPCVYYKMTVWREYEETYWETNSQTNEQERKTRRSSDVVSSNSQRLPFYLEDATGRIPVNPEGADIDAIKVVDRFEPADTMVAIGNIGSFRLDVNLPSWGNTNHRVLGYKFEESILPMDRQVYVLGEAVDADGRLALQKPSEKGKKFIISLKSEEELIRSAGSSIRWLTAGAAGSGAIGVILIVVGLITKI
jgi:hypothetical protein